MVFLFSLGNTLEAYTMERTRRSIRRLTELAPQVALVRKNEKKGSFGGGSSAGGYCDCSAGSQDPGGRVVVLGSSAVNQAAITGESIPVFKGAGDEVFAGTLNENGFWKFPLTGFPMIPPWLELSRW